MAHNEHVVGISRWLTPDPMGGDLTNPQSLNRYAYALNNPETLVDPSGLSSCPLQALQHGICRPFGAGTEYLPPGGAVILEPTLSGTVDGMDEFDVAFPVGCSQEGCVSTIDSVGAQSPPAPGGAADSAATRTPSQLALTGLGSVCTIK
jgi:uncharacterized protein RhaS with RHS repeats